MIPGTASSTGITLPADTVYYLVVGGYSSYHGNFGLTISVAPVDPDTFCAMSVPLGESSSSSGWLSYQDTVVSVCKTWVTPQATIDENVSR